jgi:hypothetical protein
MVGEEGKIGKEMMNAMKGGYVSRIQTQPRMNRRMKWNWMDYINDSVREGTGKAR